MRIKREVKPIKDSEIPKLSEVLEKEMGTGVVFTFPEKDIIFLNSKLSPVKYLKVNIVSTESQDMAVLHRLHSQTRI